MLSTQEQIHRLEDLLARVRKNRVHLGAAASAASPEPQSSIEDTVDLPSPSEPPPVERISWVPETKSAVTAAAAPAEPTPMILSPTPTAPLPATKPELEPIVAEPEPKPEPAPITAAPIPEPEPEPELVTVIPPARGASGFASAPAPEAAPLETRTFEAAPKASSPVIAVTGTPPRDWNLRAVLDRAWRVGQSDADKA